MTRTSRNHSSRNGAPEAARTAFCLFEAASCDCSHAGLTRASQIRKARLSICIRFVIARITVNIEFRFLRK